MQEKLIEAICAAASLPVEQVRKNFVRTQDISHGDFAFPCFQLSRVWKLSPPECALKLKELVLLPAGVSRVEVAGPYVNFFLDRGHFSRKVLEGILESGLDSGKKPVRSETIIVEYSSPNIAKPLHVGHLRNISIGHALELLYRHLGYKVISIDHLGDWGTQFGFVYAGCKLWGRPSDPGIEALVGLYVRASNLRKAQEEGCVPAEDADKPDVNQMARDYFKRLEADEPEAMSFWKWCLDISMDYFEKVYARLGVKFDHHMGEAFYRGMIPGVEKMLRESGILQDSKGALGVDLGKELGFVRIFTEDGRSLYMTREIATANYRCETFNPARILHVVAMQQELHFRQFKEIMRRLKHPAADLVVHVAYGYVPGMKTRQGSAVGLSELLDEARERALVAYREEVTKRPEGVDETEIAEKVGTGAIIFYLLSHGKNKDMQFSWREALNFQGDSGPYVQYALARLNSILGRAAEAGVSLADGFEGALLDDHNAHELVVLLSRFSETLEKAAADYEPNQIASYALLLARTFSASYQTLRVLGEEMPLARARLALFTALRYVLHTCLGLIGVPPVEKM